MAPDVPSTETEKVTVKLASRQIGVFNQVLFTVCLLAQLATVIITWPLWQARTDFPNLPWIAGTPQFSTGVLLIASCVLAWLSPRKFGVAIHLGLLAVAILMDQVRCQPQVLAIAVMTAGCVWSSANRIGVWYLASLWFWAGTHKLLSPDWMGHTSLNLLGRTGISDLTEYHWWFALLVAASEIGLALLVWLQPKIAALFCIAIHLGIICFLLLIQWNFSVIPWNICTATVGSVWLWRCRNADHQEQQEKRSFELAAGLVLLLLPIGFYFGWVRHSLAHVLYSNYLPEAAITGDDGIKRVTGWKEFHVPFPHVHKTYRDYFALVGKPNEKLHISEPRSGLSSRFYGMSPSGRLRELSADQFFASDSQTVAGIGLKRDRSFFVFRRGGATMKIRAKNQPIYAIEFKPDLFRQEMLVELVGLPNLEEVSLADCDIEDDDLRYLSGLRKLTGINLAGTDVTDGCLKHLRSLPRLQTIVIDGTQITDAGLEQLAR